MKIDAKLFNDTIDEIETSKGISRDTVIAALEDAMARAYRKELGGDDAVVRVNFDLEKGEITMEHAINVVEEVQDDFLEISVEDANKKDPKHKYKVGDEYIEYASLETLKNATLHSVKSIMKQKFVEAERGILYEAFKDKIGTMITGKVETFDEKGASINIGRTSVFLPRKEMIGDEKYVAGSNIKLFVSDVANGGKGNHIEVSRANEGFLKAVFAEEISEVYNGTIVIKAAARQAGERSKVAVYSADPNVDPAGACIGPNGSRVQKVVGQLGNGTTSEKVDVIAWSANPALFIKEALKPAKILGIMYDEEDKTATAIVDNNSLSLAIGKKGVNVRLAVKLTGYKIDVMTEDDAAEEGFTYTTIDELEALEAQLKAQRISELQKAQIVIEKENVLPGLPEGYVAPQARVYEPETNDMDVALNEISEKEDVDDNVAVDLYNEPVQKPVSTNVKDEKIETTVVKTTTSLNDLEASLEAEASKNKKQTSFKKFKRKDDVSEEKQETTVVSKNDNANNMSIYTDEELAEIEKEEASDKEEVYDEEEIDYDEYDDYYDESK